MKSEQISLSKQKRLTRLQANDEAVFEALFRQHYERIYNIVFRLLGNRVDTEDITQQVFLKLYHSLDQINLHDDETNVVGWLYRVAVNAGYDALRHQKRRATWHEKFVRLWSFSPSPPDPAQLVESQDRQSQVQQILAGMKPRDAKLLLLRHAGLSYKELAGALDIAPGSVGSLLTQAKRTFAKKYRLTFPEQE